MDSYRINKCNCKKPDCNICSYYYRNYPYPGSLYGNNFSSEAKLTKCCLPYIPDKQKCKKNIITTWQTRYLVSNLENKAAHLDKNLIDPIGLVIANNEIWVANSFTDTLTSYDLHGNKLHVPVRIKSISNNSGFPTGITVNNSGEFAVSNGIRMAPSFIMAVTNVGTIHAYNFSINSEKSFIVTNEMLSGFVTVYKGCAIVGNYLYCADFYNLKIDVFNGKYILLNSFPFVDGDLADPLPPDYGPANIAHIGCYLYVVYCKQAPTINIDMFSGPGNGYVSIFNLDGTFVRRFHSRGVLNAPWGIIPAPCECGFPKNGILIGNNGDGTINIFDCAGVFCGKLLTPAGIPFSIIGLWGLATYYKCTNEIFFTAAPAGNTDEGILGSLVVDQVLTV